MNPETQLKIFVFLERLWMCATILGICCMAYYLIMRDNDSALFFFGFFILSGILYLLRKRQRQRFQTEMKKD